MTALGTTVLDFENWCENIGVDICPLYLPFPNPFYVDDDPAFSKISLLNLSLIEP